MRRQGYTKEEALNLLLKPTGKLTAADKRVVESIYSKTDEEMGEPRGATKNPFNFVSIKDLLQTDETVDWLVDGL